MRHSGKLVMVSHFSGRLRVRAEKFRQRQELGAAFAEHVGAKEGVTSTQFSAITGSLLVRYNPLEIELNELVSAMLLAGGFEGILAESPPVPNAPPAGVIGERIRSAAGLADDAVQRFSTSTVDLRTGVPLTLAGMGAAIFLTGRRRLPNWYDLLFWGFTTFVNFNPSKFQPPWQGPHHGESK